MSTVKLQGNDDKEPFDVDRRAACCSELIKNFLNNLGPTEEDKNVVVPLPKVTDAILRKTMEWAEHHKDDPEPPNDDQNNERRSNDVSLWDLQYLAVDQETLLELVSAANYLVMRGLLHLTCKTVAFNMKGKSPEEMREIFNINNDAQEQLLREEFELVMKNLSD